MAFTNASLNPCCYGIEIERPQKPASTAGLCLNPYCYGISVELFVRCGCNEFADFCSNPYYYGISAEHSMYHYVKERVMGAYKHHQDVHHNFA